MRRLLQFVLEGFPISPDATHALEATMADWRHEKAAATTLGRRCWVALVGPVSVARVLAGVSLKELPGAWKAPFLWRTATVLLLFVATKGIFDPPERFVDVLSGWDLSVLATGNAVQAVFLVLPLVAFISEATGRRSRQAPTAGAWTLMAIGIAMMMSILPEFATFQAKLSWTHFANAATPPPVPLPSAYRFFAGGPVAPTTPDFWIRFVAMLATLILSTVALSALAYQVRQGRTLRAWLIGVTPFFAVFASVYGVMLLSVLVGVAWRDALIWNWPIRIIAFVASVTVLPLILAAHLARYTSRPAISSNAEVTA